MMRHNNPQSLNQYAYALNNPLNRIDPSGLDAADPGYCDVSYANCGGGGDGNVYYVNGFEVGGGGGGSGLGPSEFYQGAIVSNSVGTTGFVPSGHGGAWFYDLAAGGYVTPAVAADGFGNSRGGRWIYGASPLSELLSGVLLTNPFAVTLRRFIDIAATQDWDNPPALITDNVAGPLKKQPATLNMSNKGAVALCIFTLGGSDPGEQMPSDVWPTTAYAPAVGPKRTVNPLNPETDYKNAGGGRVPHP